MYTIEEWEYIEGYGGWYMVSNLGRVKSYKRTNSKRMLTKLSAIILKPRLVESNKRLGKYLSVCLYDGDGKSKKYYIHRLVAFYFIERNRGYEMQVNHINGNTLDNKATNLEWVTQSDNQLHSRISRKGHSRFPGVTKSGKYWKAQTTINGKHKSIGHSMDEYECALMYYNFVKDNNGKYAIHPSEIK
jgi:hypothetical protein